jgi:hypothetical protein
MEERIEEHGNAGDGGAIRGGYPGDFGGVTHLTAPLFYPCKDKCAGVTNAATPACECGHPASGHDDATGCSVCAWCEAFTPDIPRRKQRKSALPSDTPPACGAAVAFPARFLKRLRVTGGGCWEWTGATVPGGYGRLRGDDARSTLAHRAAWLWANGPFPDGLKVCHRCDNPPCCNPEHLFLGTQLENMRDCVAKGRFRGGRRGAHV